MIRGRLRTFKTTDGGRLHKIVVVSKNETVHPVTIASPYVPFLEPGFVRAWERIKINRTQTTTKITVYDRKKGAAPARMMLSNEASVEIPIPTSERRADNTDKTKGRVRAEKESDIVPPSDFVWAEPVPGIPTTEQLSG